LTTGAPRELELGRSWYVPLVLAALCAATAWGSTFDSSGLLPKGLFKDFNAFYCAGAALDEHANPYLSEPLGSCESAPKPLGLYAPPPHLVFPAPLPGYALDVFGALARLPYGAAAMLWAVVLCTACWVAVRATYALAGGSPASVAAAYALGTGYAALCLGQVAALAVAGIALAAFAARRDRPWLAAAAIAVAALEPHVALPAGLSLFAFFPRARLPLAVAAIALTALSIGSLGIARNVQYFREVLPAHVYAEALNDKQFSLTYVLRRLGAGAAAARAFGEASYAIMVALGLVQARRLARAGGDAAYLAAIPPLFAVAGGPFVHVFQIGAALPAGFLLHSGAARGRAPLGLAIALLAVPWVQFANVGTIFTLMVPLAAGVCCFGLISPSPWRIGLAAGGAIAILAVLETLVTAAPPLPAAALAAHWQPQALAEESWALYMATYGSFDEGLYALAKLPTWLGLAVLIAAAFTLRPTGPRTSRW
jgi:hypothetical protein